VTLGSIVLILAGTLAWIAAADLPKSKTGTLALDITGDSLQLARGQKVVESVCAYCHRASDATLSGKLFLKEESGFGVAYAPNLTRHPASAISAYSDAELAYFLRTGIKRDGTFAGPFMTFPHLADEDLAGIIAYLRSDTYSTEPRAVKHPAPQWGLFAKALMRFGIFAPVPTDGQPVRAPDPADQLAYGRYLTTGVYECSNCHSASFETNNILEPEASEGFCGGGNPLESRNGQEVFSANLTPHPTTGLGSWTYEEFAAAVRSGIGKQNQALDPAMPRFVHLDNTETRAIWAYLQSVPPLENDVRAMSADMN
jgi:mono/diheme cytochrome c family protein